MGSATESPGRKGAPGNPYRLADLFFRGCLDFREGLAGCWIEALDLDHNYG